MPEIDPDFVAPFGLALAQAVATLLKSGHPIVYSHRDYCGAGLEFLGGKFRYGSSIYDGAMEKAEREFASAEEFVKWLSEQSDFTMCGEGPWKGNQRITRERLLGALEEAGVPFVQSS